MEREIGKELPRKKCNISAKQKCCTSLLHFHIFFIKSNKNRKNKNGNILVFH